MKLEKTYSRSLLLLIACTALAGCILDDDDDEDADAATGNSPPAIWGDPGTGVVVSSQYLFLPEASDDDGDVLTFSIVNKPSWAVFEETTGELRGVPASDDVGSYDDIVISVTDDNSIASLAPFSIDVTTGAGGADPGDDSVSQAPSISGDPNEFVVAGTTYAFQPDALDPDGDALSFSITNKPVWASFDTATGRLQGQPTAASVGTSAPIEVSVTDGRSVAALASFTITVQDTGTASYTVVWNPPTENEDGTPLTDLAGYRIYYGMVSGVYTETVVLDQPGLTSYPLDGLAPGRYFLVMTAVDGEAMESGHSDEAALEPST